LLDRGARQQFGPVERGYGADQDLDRPEALMRGVDRCDRVRGRHGIHRDELDHGCGAPGQHGFPGLDAACLVPGEQGDPADAGVREGPRGRKPDTRGTAGDDYGGIG
jgi:hypothetical protein